MAGAMVMALTACGAKTDETTVETPREAPPTEETTTETTTEATTEESVVTFTPEEHAQLVMFTKDNSDSDFATDFDFGNASYEVFNFDGFDWPGYPNYPVGEDIVITFKSDKDLKWGSIIKYGPDVDLSIDIFREDADITYLAYDKAAHNANTDEWTYTTNINEFVTCSDGVYTLTIPAEYVESEYAYKITLATDQASGWSDPDVDQTPEYSLEFHVRSFPAQ